MFLLFDQNNSGGGFDFDKKAGITETVVVEGNDYDHCISRALDIGIYFDGCEKGLDCDCCGDRWYEPWDEEGLTLDQMKEKVNKSFSFMKKYQVCIHFLNGAKVWVNTKGEI